MSDIAMALNKQGKVALDAKGYPDQKGIDAIFEELDYQRASQAYLWAMPAVGMEGQALMQKHFGATGPYDSLLLFGADVVGGMLTPNSTVGYVITMSNLLETGPLVLENPEGETAGILMDYWQRWIADVGLPGPSKGKSEKLLILGPGQEVPDGAEGYRVVHSLSGLFGRAAIRRSGRLHYHVVCEIAGLRYCWGHNGVAWGRHISWSALVHHVGLWLNV
jgi:hypothetical protein